MLFSCLLFARLLVWIVGPVCFLLFAARTTELSLNVGVCFYLYGGFIQISAVSYASSLE